MSHFSSSNWHSMFFTPIIIVGQDTEILLFYTNKGGSNMDKEFDKEFECVSYKKLPFSPCLFNAFLKSLPGSHVTCLQHGNPGGLLAV